MANAHIILKLEERSSWRPNDYERFGTYPNPSLTLRTSSMLGTLGGSALLPKVTYLTGLSFSTIRSSQRAQKMTFLAGAVTSLRHLGQT